MTIRRKLTIDQAGLDLVSGCLLPCSSTYPENMRSKVASVGNTVDVEIDLVMTSSKSNACNLIRPRVLVTIVPYSLYAMDEPTYVVDPAAIICVQSRIRR